MREKQGKIIQLPYVEIAAMSDERRCLQLSERSVQMLLAQTQYLTWAKRWAKDGEFTQLERDNIDRWAGEAVSDLMRLDACDSCNDYFPQSSIFTFEPQNPFTEPDLIPDAAYNFPPFYILDGAGASALLGGQVGDVITDITRISANPLDWSNLGTIGFPRFRVTVTGEGEIELHLLKVPQGGLAFIVIDENPLTAKFAFCNSISVVDLDGLIETLLQLFGLVVAADTFIGEEIIEFDILGGGEHTVDVTFLPQIDSDVLLGFGGGVRKITLCGFVPQGDCEDMDVRQNDLNPCILEKTSDGETWEEFADLTLCNPCLRVNAGVIEVCDGEGNWTPIEQIPPETGATDDTFPEPTPRTEATGDDRKCLAAANATNVIRLMHYDVTKTFGDDFLFGTAGSLVAMLAAAIFFPPSLVVTFPIVVAMAGFLAFVSFSDWTQTITDDLQCILYCAATDTGGVVTFNHSQVLADVFPLISDNMWACVYYYLQIIQAGGLNLAGTTSAITEATCECIDCGGCQQYLNGHGNEDVEHTQIIGTVVYDSENDRYTATFPPVNSAAMGRIIFDNIPPGWYRVNVRYDCFKTRTPASATPSNAGIATRGSPTGGWNTQTTFPLNTTITNGLMTAYVPGGGGGTYYELHVASGSANNAGLAAATYWRITSVEFCYEDE